jgi:hypothetical protein
MRQPPELTDLPPFNPNRQALGAMGLMPTYQTGLTPFALAQLAVLTPSQGAAAIDPYASDPAVAGGMPVGERIVAALANYSANDSLDDMAQKAIAATAWRESQSDNNTSFLNPGLHDPGPTGPAPSYLSTLPPYPYQTANSNKVDFPYPNPAPHWTSNLKWWTGQTILNVGAPRYRNDPFEYLRSALVDSNWDMVHKWCDWFLAAAGMPAGKSITSASPWAHALSLFDFSQFKYILTSNGTVWFPMNWADLQGFFTQGQPYMYDFTSSTFVTWRNQWRMDNIADYVKHPDSGRLDPMQSNPYHSPLVIPMVYRVGSTWLSEAAPYIEIAAVIAGGIALAAVLAPGSGVGAAASAAASGSTSAAAGATDAAALSADAAGSVAAASSAAASAAVVGADVLPEITVASTVAASTGLTAAGASAIAAASAAGAAAIGAANVAAPPPAPTPMQTPPAPQPMQTPPVTETLPEVTVSSTVPTATSALTANGAAAIAAASTAGAAAVGAANVPAAVSAPQPVQTPTPADTQPPAQDVLPEVVSTATPLTAPALTATDLAIPALDTGALLASVASTPINYPVDTSQAPPASTALSPSTIKALPSLISKLFGSGSGAVAPLTASGGMAAPQEASVGGNSMLWLILAGLGVVAVAAHGKKKRSNLHARHSRR